MTHQDILDAFESPMKFEPVGFETITHKQLMREQYEPLRWIIPSLLPEGLTILAGSPKIGKSWLALALCEAVAYGSHSINGTPVESGDVLYLALEDNPRRLQDRFKKLDSQCAEEKGVLELCMDAPRADWIN